MGTRLRNYYPSQLHHRDPLIMSFQKMYGLGGPTCLLRPMQGTQPLWATMGLTLPGPCCMPLIPAASFLVPPCPVCHMLLQPSKGAMLPRQAIATALKCAPCGTPLVGRLG